MSSANNLDDPCKFSEISLIYIRNNSGLCTGPWGAPAVMFLEDESYSLMHTVWFLFSTARQDHRRCAALTQQCKSACL